MYYRQPRYWDSFQCIGGGCSDNCCARKWRIDWSKEEIDKVKNAPNCSDELRTLMETNFKPNPHLDNYMVITLDEKNRCPMLTEDKFCRIQRELGAEYLSFTCMNYPRMYFVTGSVVYRNCSASCPEIMKKLLNDEKCMDMVNARIRVEKTIPGSQFDSPEKVKEHPEWKYVVEAREFFYDIISDRKLPTESCIILGALAAQALTKLIGTGEYDRIPEALKSFKAQMHNAEQLRSIENIRPNYNIKLGVTDKLSRELFSSDMINSLIDGDGKPNIDLYIRAEQLLNKEFENRQFAWRNIALNLLLEVGVPFKFEELTVFETYSIFVISYALIRYNTLTVMSYNDRLLGKKTAVSAENNNELKLNFRVGLNTEQYIAGFSTSVSRILMHNPDLLKRISKQLKDLGITSPAYLALLVK